MAEWVLQVAERKESGKAAAGRLRRQGLVPAVLYGREAGNLALQVPAKELLKVLEEAGEKALLRLQVQDAAVREYPVLVQEVQWDPVRHTLTHVDFHQVSLEQEIVTEVPVVLVGEAPGVKQGGILQHGTRTVEVACLPRDLPAELVLDISSLGRGDTATAADLQLPPAVKLVSDPATVLASIVAPRGVTESEAEEKPAEGAGPVT